MLKPKVTGINQFFFLNGVAYQPLLLYTVLHRLCRSTSGVSPGPFIILALKMPTEAN